MKKGLLLYLFLVVSLTLQGNVYFKHIGKTDGLPQISVMSICQDELGRMWFGTLEGLGCYDGNSMTVYKPSSEPTRNFLGNEIHNLVSDKQGNIFFTSDNVLIHYDLHKEQFSPLQRKVNCLHAQGHTVWAATQDSVFKWNPAKKQFAFVYRLKPSQYITSLYSDTNDCLWLGTSRGLYRIDNLATPTPVCVIAEVNVHSLYRDTKGRMWVAAFRQGMYKIENGISQKFVIEKDFALSNNDVRCFVEDNEGSIWIGTFNGLNKIDTAGNVSYYKKDTQPGNLKHSSIFSLYKDSQGTIWAGTYYGGVQYFNPQMDFFRHYSEDADRTDCLSFFFVGNMAEDKRGDIWICTEGGGLNYLNRKTRLFTHYLAGEHSSGPSFYNLKCTEYDPVRDCIYVGTHKQGFFCFDIPTRKIKYHTEDAGTSLSKITLRGDSLYILSSKGMLVKNLQTGTTGYLYPSIQETRGGGSSFLIDSKKHIWIAQHKQIVRINMQKPEEKYIYKYGEKGLGKFQVLEMAEYPDGTLYLGTYGTGLYKFNPRENSFEQCAVSNIHYCYDLAVTPHGYLAISNEKGLLIYHPETREMRMLDAESQLHLSAINDGCGLLICRNGETFVGGASGMTSFMNTSLLTPSPQYNLYFSSLAVNDRLISCETPNHILSAALPFANRINLEYNENNISITVASNSYIDNTDRKIYEYRLEGFSKEWSTSYNNTIVYTNLDPGKYKLIVREKQQGSLDDVHSIELSIVVHSPWWATWLAYLIYTGIVAAIVYVLLNNWQTRMQLRASLAQEKLEKEKNEELIQAKLQFFANISHEFRTPLTLIISQIEALLQSGNHSPFLRTRLQKIYKNTFQFRELISELLDFRKMERGKLQLHVCQLDIVAYLKQIHLDFTDQAQLQNIHFDFQTDAESLMCWYDGRQLRKVFSNLLSNAFKHTPEKGKVELQIHEKETTVEIKVIDTGEGIPQEALPYIFDRFYQVDTAVSSPGSGIGLALSKGVVELHHGKISVQSALQYGTIFTVTLPKDNLFQEDNYVTFATQETSGYDYAVPSEENTGTENRTEKTEEESGTQESPTDKDCILVVEDNEELLQILTSLLSPLYRVSIAMNGKEGLRKAMEERPELILSDIMMPEMSGTEMCSKIKNNFELCHIPVVLLTALTSDNKKMEGLQCGADDYIEKPFNNKMLLGHIANIIRNRKLLKQKFGKDISAGIPAETEIQALALNPIDAKFLTKLEDIVKEHLADPAFDVNMLAKELAVSRSSLYNKLRALSCMTPNEFILNSRLKHAAELLKSSPELQITEIAYQTGFNSLRYFRHCFKACFNQTPQEYRGC
ncbi:two-component regulator propeller domain-containing protein [Bacteroides fluxus]|uniref:two-component regulator propeller domain-containing protein n=1 Tax=Bacteroides fluxus TaxID=626930 RepID=UPI0023A7FCFB|nr:two-component regulator propeller domain-containing protein [Bacteroides fluxus]